VAPVAATTVARIVAVVVAAFAVTTAIATTRQGTRADGPTMIEKVVFINRCAKVVKGGRRFSFAALAVVGDGKGKVGIATARPTKFPDAIKKGTANAHKHSSA